MTQGKPQSLAAEGLTRTGKGYRKVEDSELRELRSQGLNNAQIVRELRSRGVSISRQAVSLRMKALTPGGSMGEQLDEAILPWEVKAPHNGQNQLYREILAYEKWRRGIPQNEHYRGLAVLLEKTLMDAEKYPPMGAVLLYRPERGFMLRARRPGDGPSILVES